MFPVVVPEVRQTDTQIEKYNTNNGFKYQSLSNSLSNSEGSLNNCETIHEGSKNNYLNSNGKLVKSTSDQKLPDKSSQKSFTYVNKNGQLIKSSMPDHDRSNKRENGLESSNGQEMLCESFLVNMAKSNNNKDDLKRMNNDNNKIRNFNTRSVPTAGYLNSSESGNNDSTIGNNIVTQDKDVIRINTSITQQETNIEVTYEHVKYINMFSLLCCWCFPFTGILSVIYARLTAKYYNMRDLKKAQRYLKYSEWMLIATFFMGFTIIACVFAYIQHYVFSDSKVRNAYYSGHHQMPSFVPK